ncbi:2,3-bisphosphoglycerate-dependent phosphoglycerate mutase [Emiliania huxleyi CCMP1516]|uniref:phosphoglycerate mutase (2,3-diphosphoglycerate-dependent) n=2 Tax=Emiliania huxleyi TaxID=2903 RepID=A0A0D3KJF9_EMIH1|nr:2,3-bisphosphoglycerate-dependent phosphoglycerate mutase [Emiliania huxleyi CCMP1516]EOD35894.1 2,3-bisphosphoglycerate-dependent phosphoglycerate mutase [Emiliania huxleyi CCMP1516]|eukprot:XP_005788323.1 2,3-bisphosphoglycerate-dependent phosphoglycerate mutase [Emiliania huxleyi CCMP1516]
MKSFALVVLALAAAEALQLHPAGANGAVRTAGAIGAVRTAGALRPAARRSGEIHLLDKKGEAHSTVVFLRHGQSTWNADSLFTGWADVELTTLGKNEAAGAAATLWKEGIEFDVAYCSRLKRARQTLEIVLSISGQEEVPVNACWRLNERMYGGLTGLNKKETAAKYGDEQVKRWRRSYDVPPPPVEKDSPYYPGNNPQYYHIREEELPLSECLKARARADTLERTLPYWESDIVPALTKGKTVNEIFEMVDRNGDGRIDFEEFVQAITAESLPR